MASMFASNEGSQSAPAVRLPRLSYRIKSSDAESINTVSTDRSRSTASTNLTSPSLSTFPPSPREPPSSMTSPTSTRPSSIAPSSVAPRTPNNSSKKRPGLLHGFFGAKEPSAQAFADYQKQLLKQKDGRVRTNTAGLPGVSSAKLPPTVPKVNSKWDGVPETLKNKEKQKPVRQSMSSHGRGHSAARSVGSDSRPSATSASNKRLSGGTMGGTSTHSNSSSNRLADLYGWESSAIAMTSSSAVVDFAAEHRPTTSRLETSHSAPPPTARPPPLERTTLFPPHNTSLRRENSQPYCDLPSPLTPGSPPSLSHSNSPALTPSDSLPRTPDLPSDLTPPHVDSGRSDDIRTTLVDVPASVDEVVIKSAGLNILGPPATAKWRAKLPTSQSGGDRPNTSGMDMPLNSILKKDTSKDAIPRPAMQSYFPSPSSAPPPIPVRRNSARDRLGLGINMKNQVAAPWSSPNDKMSPGTQGERIITPTPESGQHMRKKSRMSLFKK